MTSHQRLPRGFRVRIRDDVRRLDSGSLLVGGSPTRAMRLTGRAAEALADGTVTVHDALTERVAGRLLDGNLADPVLDEPPSGTSAEPSNLTVVVPVRDRPEHLDRCLSALDGLAVVVVDDASLNPRAVSDVVARHRAVLLKLDRNVGPAGARNAGLKAVTTEFVAFVDSDVIASPATLLRLCRHFADRSMALVGPRVAGIVRTNRPRWFERYDAIASSLDLGRTPCQVKPGARVGWLPSACLVARVSMLGDGFDVSMRVGEDVDLVWRLVERGARVRYDPTAVVHHDVRPSVGGWLGRKFVYGTGGAALTGRHGNKAAPAVLTIPMAIGAGAVLLRRRWSIPVVVATTAVTTVRLNRSLPQASDRLPAAIGLSLQALGWGVKQESALALRHWWPVAALACLTSRHARRAALTALSVDALVASKERPEANPALMAVGRRLDDLAYGSGLWYGALKSADFRCLAPRRPGRP